MFDKIGVFTNVANFSGKYMRLSLFFSKAAGPQAGNFIKKRFQDSCFPGKLAKFLRTPFLTDHLRWLLLKDIFSESVPTKKRKRRKRKLTFPLKH